MGELDRLNFNSTLKPGELTQKNQGHVADRPVALFSDDQLRFPGHLLFSCEVCSWFPLCDTRRRDDDHLSLVAGITQMQRKELGSREINTVARLASLPLPVVPKIDRIGDAALLRVRDQARIQIDGRNEGRLVYELLEPIEEQKGLAALPSPSPGDIFLDFEAVPYAFDTGLEYLIGAVTVPDRPHAEPTYKSLWSFERMFEKSCQIQVHRMWYGLHPGPGWINNAHQTGRR